MDEEAEIWINGEKFTVDDLTYREQRKMREYVRELAPDGDVTEGGEIDYIPPMIAVIQQRSDPAFTLDQALDVRPTELAPPTKPAARKK